MNRLGVETRTIISPNMYPTRFVNIQFIERLHIPVQSSPQHFTSWAWFYKDVCTINTSYKIINHQPVQHDMWACTHGYQHWFWSNTPSVIVTRRTTQILHLNAINQSINQSISQSISQLVNQSIRLSLIPFVNSINVLR